MRPTAIDMATVEKLVSAAAAAPSIHNTQPWRFRWHHDRSTLDVLADLGRVLPEEDPGGRALHVSVGAAVLNARVAATGLGLDTELCLLPDPSEPELLAELRCGGHGRGTDTGLAGLYDAIWQRHSSRRPFSDRRPPEAVLTALSDAARAEGAQLHFPDQDEVERLRQLTAEAEWNDHIDAPRREESRQWIRESGEDGLRRETLGPRDAAGRLPVRDFSSSRPGYTRRPERFEAETRLGVLSTVHDGRVDWLRAGQALERVLLQATAEGLVASLLHQALEWPQLRWLLRDASEGIQHVQMIIRLGYGSEGPASPRRTVDQVLDRPRDAS